MTVSLGNFHGRVILTDLKCVQADPGKRLRHKSFLFSRTLPGSAKLSTGEASRSVGHDSRPPYGTAQPVCQKAHSHKARRSALRPRFSRKRETTTCAFGPSSYPETWDMAPSARAMLAMFQGSCGLQTLGVLLGQIDGPGRLNHQVNQESPSIFLPKTTKKDTYAPDIEKRSRGPCASAEKKNRCWQTNFAGQGRRAERQPQQLLRSDRNTTELGKIWVRLETWNLLARISKDLTALNTIVPHAACRELQRAIQCLSLTSGDACSQCNPNPRCLLFSDPNLSEGSCTTPLRNDSKMVQNNTVFYPDMCRNEFNTQWVYSQGVKTNTLEPVFGPGTQEAKVDNRFVVKAESALRCQDCEPKTYDSYSGTLANLCCLSRIQ